MKRGFPRWDRWVLIGTNHAKEARNTMLHLGMDLSRTRIDVHVVDEEGKSLEVSTWPPDHTSSEPGLCQGPNERVAEQPHRLAASVNVHVRPPRLGDLVHQQPEGFRVPAEEGNWCSCVRSCVQNGFWNEE